jgi:transcription elongation factor GreA
MADLVAFTKEGYETLQQELQRLKSEDRPKVIEEIAEARSHGDLSENAEYSAAREKQGFIEGRIAELDDKLARANVIDFSNTDADQVRFGAFVTIHDLESEERKKYRVVGDLEADLSQNKISLSSPLARAMLGKKIGDLIEVQAPKGVRECEVVEISYK